MFSKELAVKLLKIIDERDMTLESVAEATGLTYRFISNVTRGVQVPGLDTFEKICAGLELEPNDLLINEKSKLKDKSRPMNVNKVYCKGESFSVAFLPVCPSCEAILHREFENYCEKCGQRLSWKDYENSELIMNDRVKELLKGR